MTTTTRSRLSVILGEETRTLHRSAERTHTMGRLLRGELPLASYLLLLRNLHELYREMEGVLAGLSDRQPVLSWLAGPELRPSYMGDLSGGQILARLVARHYGLEPPRGVRIYAFAGDAEEHKNTFRRLLDEIAREDHPRMVATAREGFRHSIRMLDAVAEGS